MTFSIAWGSCENRWNLAYAAYSIVDGYRCKAFFRLGDMPYVNQGATCWGTTTVGVDKSSSVVDFLSIYTQSDANPGMKYIDAHCDSYRMYDDHELGGNDWDHTYTFAELNGSAIGTANNLAGQNERNEHFWRGMQAFEAFKLNNPDNSDANVVGVIPRGAQMFGANPPLAQYKPRYFRVGYSLSGVKVTKNPHVEFFVLDCISHRDPLQQADRTTLGIGANDVTMLGAVQRQWLLTRLAASTAKFKVIFSGKKLFKNTVADNGDIWAVNAGSSYPSAGYEVERDNILNVIEAATDWIEPGGVVWCSGDRHAGVVDVRNKTDGAAWDVLNVTSSMFSKEGVAGGQDGVLTKYFQNTKMTFGVLFFSDNRLDISIVDSNTGSILWTGGVFAGSNKLSYLSANIAV